MYIEDDGLSPTVRMPGTLPARWWDRMALRRACEDTLNALQAEGFHYGYGELRIPNEQSVIKFRPSVERGYGQSVAASCTEAH